MKNYSTKKLGQNIKKERERLGLSQSELAKRTGLSRQQITNWEGALYDLGFSNVVKVADALEVPVTALMEGIGEFAGWLPVYRVAIHHHATGDGILWSTPDFDKVKAARDIPGISVGVNLEYVSPEEFQKIKAVNEGITIDDVLEGYSVSGS